MNDQSCNNDDNISILMEYITSCVRFSPTSEIDGGGAQHKGGGAVLTHQASLLG
jgi:hypothetical protein